MVKGSIPVLVRVDGNKVDQLVKNAQWVDVAGSRPIIYTIR